MSEKISVIVPVYNVEPYLRQCVDSILAQTYRYLEVILIDDGSTDGSGLICDEYEDADRRVKVLHGQNYGVAVARNRGIEAACGELIAFVDADDYLSPTMFERMADAIVRTGADMAACGERIVRRDDPYGHSHYPWINEMPADSIITGDAMFRVLYAKSAVLRNKLFTRHAIGYNRFVKGMSYGEDAFFFEKMIRFEHKAVIVPGDLYFYRREREGNISTAKIDQRSEELLRNTTDIYSDLSRQGYGDIGVRRVLIAVDEVLEKIETKHLLAPEYEEYRKACQTAIRIPQKSDIRKMCADKSYPNGRKRRYKWYYFSLKLSLWIRSRKPHLKTKQ